MSTTLPDLFLARIDAHLRGLAPGARAPFLADQLNRWEAILKQMDADAAAGREPSIRGDAWDIREVIDGLALRHAQLTSPTFPMPTTQPESTNVA